LRLAAALVLAPLLALCACAHAAGERSAGSGALDAGGIEFTVRNDRSDQAAAQQVARLIPSAVAAAQRWGPLPPKVAITIHPTHAAIERAVRREGYSWLRAWARHGSIDLQSPRTWSRGEASDTQLAQLLTHELTHCAMYHALGPGTLPRRIPLWFVEGMASATAGDLGISRLDGPAPSSGRPDGPVLPGAVRDAADAPAVYAAAERAFRLLVELHGEASVRRILRLLRDGEGFAAAFERGTGTSLDRFEAALSDGTSRLARR
jgi:hypothetical protein